MESTASVRSETSLTENESYNLRINTIISKDDGMIVRCTLRLPEVDFHKKRIMPLIKNEDDEEISFRRELIGIKKCDKNSPFVELILSLFMPYPEQNIVVEVQDSDSGKPIHQQRFTKDVLEKYRAAQDKTIFWVSENDPGCKQWFVDINKVSEEELLMQRDTRLALEPKFSIVVPLYKTPLDFLGELIDSIKNQTYSHWELILVRAKTESDELVQRVEGATSSDNRIKEVIIEKNEGISRNTAQGIDRATGDYVCFLDHDDLIEPNCLFEYAFRINEKPDTDMLYCDEDLLKPSGRLEAPAFKPEFNEVFLRSNNYVCHMLTIRRSLLLQLEYNNSDYDGAQDHHLTLQVGEKTDNIEHISKYLYHWRVCETSTAGQGGSEIKPYASHAGIKAVSKHLERRGIKGQVKPHHTFAFYTMTSYEIECPEPLVSIICMADDNLTQEMCDLTKSIKEKSSYKNFEIIVASTHDIPLEDNEIHVCRLRENFNRAQRLNAARAQAKGDYLIFLSDCTEIISPRWIEELLGFVQQKSVGAVCGKVLYADNTVKHAGLYLGDMPYRLFNNLPNRGLSYHGYLEVQRGVSALSADCMMVKADLFDSLNGFDEAFPHFCDVDFSLKVASSNNQIIYTPFAEVVSLETSQSPYSYSSNAASIASGQWSSLREKWGERLTTDRNMPSRVTKDWRGAYVMILC